MPDPLGLAANMPTDEAFGVILRGCGQDFDMHLSTFLDGPNPDGPRKARVALRRLTTAVDAFSPVLRTSRAADLRRRAKEMFHLLGEVRDADVLGQAAEPLEDREWLRERVRKRLRKAKAPGFGTRLQTKAALEDLLKRGKSAQGLRKASLATTATGALDVARLRCFKNGTDLSRLSDRRIHDLRKALKAWRYLAEFFSPCWADDPETPARRAAFQSLQDALGVLTDQSLLRRKGVEVNTAEAAAAEEKAQELLSALVLEEPWWRGTAGEKAR